MKIKFINCIPFLIAFVVGFICVNYSKIQSEGRLPAAVRQYYDYTNLKGSALEVALKERLVTHLEIVKKDQDVGLKLGHFAFRNQNAQDTLGCSEYQKVLLEFESDDMAVSGEKPRMEVQGVCKASADGTMIETIWIPYSKILAEKPSDGDFQFLEKYESTLKFENVSDVWPKKWHLIGVRLSNLKREFVVDRNEVHKILGHPYIISF